MKLHEISMSEFQGLVDALYKLGISPSNYKISSEDGTVRVFDNLAFDDDDLVDGKLPIKLAKVLGDIEYSGYRNALTSFENFPPEIEGQLSITSTGIKSFKHFPKNIITDNVIIDALNIRSFNALDLTVHRNNRDSYVSININTKSLIGIENCIRFKGGGLLSFPFSKVTDGGIGLLLIPNLNGLDEFNAKHVTKLSAPFKIIEKYLGRPDAIFECQNELIDEGYEAYAEL